MVNALLKKFCSSFFYIRNCKYSSFSIYKSVEINFTNNKKISSLLFKKLYCIKSNLYRNIMDLKSVIKIVETALPPELAEKWDKTGLLIKPENNIQVSSIFFTIDLTEEVLKEAATLKTNLIIAYHPPIFSPMSKLISDNWKDRIVMQCVKHSIAVYSPHTVCDIVKGGVNDWLIKCFDVCDIKAIQARHDFSDKSCIFEFALPLTRNLNSFIDSIVGFEVISVNQHSQTQYISLSSNLPQAHALGVLTADNDVQFVSVKSATRNDSPKGVGRVAKLKHPTKLNECITSIKNYLNLKNMRVALAVGHTLDSEIKTIAVCAGSGASVLKDVEADLYFTGEMSHHEVLHAKHSNSSVILVEHSNSERGYLQNLVDILQPQLRNVKLNLSTVDKDPLFII